MTTLLILAAGVLWLAAFLLAPEDDPTLWHPAVEDYYKYIYPHV